MTHMQVNAYGALPWALQAIQWINLNHHLAEFATLRLSAGGQGKQNHEGQNHG